MNFQRKTQDPETARQQQKLTAGLRALHEASGKTLKRLRKPCSLEELNTITRALHLWLFDEVTVTVRNQHEE